MSDLPKKDPEIPIATAYAVATTANDSATTAPAARAIGMPLTSTEMTMTETSIPIAIATVDTVRGAATYAPATVASTIATATAHRYLIIDIPIGHEGISFKNSSLNNRPIQVTSNGNLPSIEVGMYVDSFILPNLKISNLHDGGRFQQLFDSNIKSARQLCLVNWTTAKEERGVAVPTINKNDGFHYHHAFPAMATDFSTSSNSFLGISLTGFPPIVVFVDPKSPFSGKIHPNHMVQGLHIPGHKVMNLQSGGFTAANVIRELHRNASVEGKIFVVKEPIVTPPKQKGSNSPIDDCIIQ